MKTLLYWLLLMSVSSSAFGQDSSFFNPIASAIAAKLPDRDNRIFAVSFFTNSQGYGPHYSDYIADSLGTALTMQGVRLVTRNRLAQVMAERDLSQTSQFDASFVQKLGKIDSAAAVFGGTFAVKPDEVQITIQLLDVSNGHILLAELARFPRTPSVDEELNRTPVKQLNDDATEIGLRAIEHGKYKDAENERLIADIRNATDIKVLVVNGDNLFQTFKEELGEFFKNPASHMQVLLGNPNGDFYREETEMTQLSSKPDDPAYKANQGKVEFNRRRLLDLAKDPSLVEFRYFDTQYRLPIIIVNNKTCYLTIRLSPNESQQSVRMEFEGGKQGFAKSCVAHFNRMWSVSSATPDKKVP